MWPGAAGDSVSPFTPPYPQRRASDGVEGGDRAQEMLVGVLLLDSKWGLEKWSEGDRPCQGTPWRACPPKVPAGRARPAAGEGAD